ncbi:HlyD family efflux transporter periplasmic adaptor subunit [Alsobacter sp. R-9]
MNPAAVADEGLPPLREDLRILPSSPLPGGAPGWVVLDPVRHRYFQIGRAVLDLLSAWPAGTRSGLKTRVAARSARPVSDDEIDGVIAFLTAHELTQEPAGGAMALARRDKDRTHHWLAWLIHNYLFFKVPLLRPQAWLDRRRGLARAVFSGPVLGLTGAAGLVALALVARQWDHFVATALSFFTLEGAALYGLSLVLVKTIHELGHALMAKRYGVRVPSMGVAFMVMAPFLYSDVSDAWRLRSRRQRLAIDAAGLVAEVMLAAWALLAWVFLPDGILRSIAFVTATTSLVLSLLLNLNPFMRFDGYHLLADASGIPNLQTRAIAVGRWLMREVLFGLGAPPPEPFERRTLVILALYAYAIWIYRFFLFLGIALLVYHMAFKALGVVLFLIEIVWFIARPIAMELRVLWGGRHLVARSPRSLVTLMALVGLVVAAVVPWSTSVRVPAQAGAAVDAAVYPRSPGQVVEVRATPLATVAEGDVLVVLRSRELESEIERAGLRIALLERRRDRAAADAGDRSEWIVLGRQLDAERRRLQGFEAQRSDLVVRAPAPGVVRELDPLLKPGTWVNPRTQIARIVGTETGEVRGYVAEADLRRLSPGTRGRFVPEDPQMPAVPVVLDSIGRTAAEDLDLLPLASTNEGPVPALQDGRRLKAGAAVYPAIMTTAGPVPPTARRGTAVLEGHAESFAVRAARHVIGVLIRESGT